MKKQFLLSLTKKQLRSIAEKLGVNHYAQLSINKLVIKLMAYSYRDLKYCHNDGRIL